MKQLMSLLLIATLAIPANAADCSKPVIPLNQGDPAPCKGFFMTPQQEQKFYFLDQDHQLLQQKLTDTQKLSDSYKQSLSDFQSVIDDESKKADLWRKAAEDSTEKLVNLRSEESKKTFWLTVLSSIAVGFAVGYANHR